MNSNRSFSPSPDLDPQLESAVWAVVSEPIDMKAVERVKNRAGAMSESSPSVRPKVLTSLRSRRVLALVSLAAGILLLATAALVFPAPKSAFAQAIEQLKSARAFRYTQWLYSDQMEKPIEVQVRVAQDGRERSEAVGTVSITDSDGRMRITLIEATKTAIVSAVESFKEVPGVQPQSKLTWLEQLRSHSAKPDRELGTKSLDGRSVEGFVAKQGLYEFTIWVDSKTKDLVQVENDGMIKGSSVKKVIMKDFRFDETFDDLLFSFDVPDGYKVMKSSPAPALVSGEESVIEALRGFTKLADGKFPKSLANWGEWAVFLSKSGAPREETSVISARLGAITPFLFSMPKEDYEYLGEGKSTSDARTIVFWYRKKGGPIRAVYNDLSAADVQEADLPKKK